MVLISCFYARRLPAGFILKLLDGEKVAVSCTRVFISCMIPDYRVLSNSAFITGVAVSVPPASLRDYIYFTLTSKEPTKRVSHLGPQSAII